MFDPHRLGDDEPMAAGDDEPDRRTAEEGWPMRARQALPALTAVAAG